MKLDRLELLWCVAGALILAFFVGSAISEIFPHHFRSWHVNSKIEPVTGWAQFWKSARPWITILAYGVSGISGFVGVLRALSGAWQAIAWRVAAAFLFGVLTELLRIGVQDGSVADKDVVPPASLVLLGIGLAIPIAFALYDLSAMRQSREQRLTKDVAPAS